ncbi:hypothetical protein [Cerasicoccus maritimus]|uniref:hypothetical protein n=1 Tax=Cerasicoccus maritimus TaxID=490089 RepID=UPI00285286A8|nr:hypothetical protein [Cerasicoccus maritimus]
MSTIYLKVLPILMLGLMQVSAETVGTWDFRNGNLDTEAFLKDWAIGSVAAEQEGAIQVVPPPGLVEPGQVAMVLNDVCDSSAHKLNDADGTPLLVYKFDSIPAGGFLFRAGTSGSQNQNATITLLSRGRPLLIIKLINNTTGVLVSGTGEIEFSDPVSWFNRARSFEVYWHENGRVDFYFKPDSGDPLEIRSLRFLSPGKPNEIQIKVGYGRGTGKAVRLETISLIKQN